MASARSRGLLLLLLALASGLTATWLAIRYLREQTRPLLSVGPQRTRALVAARDLPVGTVLREQDLKAVDWPGDAVPVGLLANVPDAVGRGLITPVRLNEPILESKLAPRNPIAGGMPTLVTEGMRALSVRVDEVAGVSGFVIPGTRVDILLTMTEDTPTNEPTTRVLLQNIQALAAGQSIQPDAAGNPQSVPVLTLLVSPEQAETLALASGQGRLQMTLRNQLDTLPIETPGARRSTLMSARGRVVTRAGGRAVVRTAPVDETTVVEGFRGGERTLYRFNRPRAPDEPPDER